jgi:SAM-dependent methyltransferase
MARSGVKFELLDLVDLLLLRLAKASRDKLSTSKETDRRQFYERFFTENDENVLLSSRDPRRSFRQDEVNRALTSVVPAGELVLDIGCGLGDNLAGLPKLWRLGGIEYAMETARVARARLDGRAFVALGAGTALPIATASVAAATCLEVLEHIADDQAALLEIHRILVPGGFFLAAVPYRYWFKQYLPLMGHYRHYTRSSFDKMLERAGFEVMEHLANCPGWSRLINYAYVAARILSIAYRIAGKTVSPLDAKLPGARMPLLSTLTEVLRPRLLAERRLDYEQLETSTFVLAKKI